MAPDSNPDNRSDFHHLQGSGEVQPGDLVRELGQLAREPVEWRGDHFELVDASGEVSVRAGTPHQITRQADQLGITRYTQVGLDGQRTLYEKVDGSWQSSAERAPVRASAGSPADTRHGSADALTSPR
jgi:hypothetical protein